MDLRFHVEVALLRISYADRTAPLPRRTFSVLHHGRAEGCEAAQGGDTNLKLCVRTIRVACGHVLTQKLDAMHLGVSAALVILTAPPLRGWFAQAVFMCAASRCAMAPRLFGFRGLAFFRGGMIAAAPSVAMALWHWRAPKAPPHASVRAGLARAVVLRLDANSVDQQVQQDVRAAVGDVDLPRLLVTFQRVVVGYRPITRGQTQLALDAA